MKKYIKLIFFIAVAFLSGCAHMGDFQSTPNNKLCIDYMTKPSTNIWQSDRAAEISKRNLDCRPYIGVASQKRQADQDFEDSLRDLRDNY